MRWIRGRDLHASLCAERSALLPVTMTRAGPSSEPSAAAARIPAHDAAPPPRRSPRAQPSAPPGRRAAPPRRRGPCRRPGRHLVERLGDRDARGDAAGPRVGGVGLDRAPGSPRQGHRRRRAPTGRRRPDTSAAPCAEPGADTDDQRAVADRDEGGRRAAGSAPRSRAVGQLDGESRRRPWRPTDPRRRRAARRRPRSRSASDAARAASKSLALLDDARTEALDPAELRRVGVLVGEDDDRDTERPTGEGAALAEVAGRGDDERPVLPHPAVLGEVADGEPRPPALERPDRVDRLDLDDDRRPGALADRPSLTNWGTDEPGRRSRAALIVARGAARTVARLSGSATEAPRGCRAQQNARRNRRSLDAPTNTSTSRITRCSRPLRARPTVRERAMSAR